MSQEWLTLISWTFQGKLWRILNWPKGTMYTINTNAKIPVTNDTKSIKWNF